MPLIDDWRERHAGRPSRVRVLIYLFLLAVVMLFMLNADSIVRGFSEIFFTPPESTEGPEAVPE